MIVALLAGKLPRRNRFGRGRFDVPKGAGGPFDVPGTPAAPYSVRVVEPVKVDAPIFSVMSLAIGAGIGYSIARVMR